ncbi:hypothetical protein ACO1O0_007883 [Amphichorda felina]
MASPPPLTPEQEATMGEDKGTVVVAVSSLFIGLCTVAVALRFYARFIRHVSLGLDDWMSAASLVFTVLYCISCMLAIPYGMGKHVWAVDPTKIWRVLQIGLFNALIYFISHFCIKLAILFFYRRVFTLRITWFKYAWYAVLFYTTGWFISSFFAGLFQCFPPAFFWEQYNPGLDPPPKGSCGAANAPLVIATSALNTGGDVLVFALPIAMLSRLQLNRANKISLFGVFATGAFAIAAGIVRLVITFSATELNADSTWITADIYMWTAVEAGVGLICACLPTTGPLFGLAVRRVTQVSSSRSRRSQREKTKLSGASHHHHHHHHAAGSGSFPQRSMANCDTGSQTNFELEVQAPAASILRTDAYYVDSYPRTDDSLDEIPGAPGAKAKPISAV